jgi:hypothetical protein
MGREIESRQGKGWLLIIIKPMVEKCSFHIWNENLTAYIVLPTKVEFFCSPRRFLLKASTPLTRVTR